MAAPLIVVTGFGPFEEVRENPSGLLAERLDGRPDPLGRVVGRRLPVGFEAAPRALDELLAELGRAPDALLLLGVHPGQGFRLEARAKASLRPGRPDALGVDAADLGRSEGPDLWSPLDLKALAVALLFGGADPVAISDDAGGYVCEALYRHALERGEALGVPALFVHVPPLEGADLDVGERALGALVRELIRQISDRERDPASVPGPGR